MRPTRQMFYPISFCGANTKKIEITTYELPVRGLIASAQPRASKCFYSLQFKFKSQKS
jgi:hypothetical protein